MNYSLETIYFDTEYLLFALDFIRCSDIIFFKHPVKIACNYTSAIIRRKFSEMNLSYFIIVATFQTLCRDNGT